MLESLDFYLKTMFRPIVSILPNDLHVLMYGLLAISFFFLIAKSSKATTVLFISFLIFAFFAIGFETVPGGI